ncbi:MAG: hypothetical protein OEV40_14510 [Acidimicrobiia bacterium]|nr:hypothetical protein [Acidimicrobiia bacterium]
MDEAATTISVPRLDEGDSFIIHAPLEVLARSALLTLVSPEGRRAVLDRIDQTAVSYADWGPPIERQPRHTDSLTADPVGVLDRALRNGDADGADDAITWLSAHLDTDELVLVLADPILPSLAVAAHGPILLYLLARAAPRSLPAASLARTTIHELVRHPDWRLSWHTEAPPAQHPEPSAELERRLVGPDLAEQPPSSFIYPTMGTTERTGLATAALADLTDTISVGSARGILLPIAAHSMLQDDPQHAPYGWSHCLTMPQAALGIARALDEPRHAVAVAATYVLGFRASLRSVVLALDHVPEPAEVPPEELVLAPPSTAAGAAWHAPPDRRPALWRALATHAAPHRDAHLAKYTLACLDATRADPGRHPLYLAAAAYLNAWWSEHSAGE